MGMNRECGGRNFRWGIPHPFNGWRKFEHGRKKASNILSNPAIGRQYRPGIKSYPHQIISPFSKTEHVPRQRGVNLEKVSLSLPGWLTTPRGFELFHLPKLGIFHKGIHTGQDADHKSRHAIPVSLPNKKIFQEGKHRTKE